MKRFLRFLIIIFVLSSCAFPANPTVAPEPSSTSVLSNPTDMPATSRTGVRSNPTDTPETLSTRVLFIGNSYTYGNDLPEVFAELANSGGHEVEVGMVAEGRWRLADHVQSPETLDRLKSKRWTFVVLQEQSQIPALGGYRVQKMYPAARELVAKIREVEATPIFFLTWAHRDGWPAYGMNDYESMQTQIKEGYEEIAQELDAPIASVGSAWLVAVQQHPELNLWREDGSHPSKQGTYLAACVFYATIFHEGPVGLAYHASLSGETAETLQNIAAKTVLDIP